jgi:hypothetical protein
MTLKGLNATMARIGLVNTCSENYRRVFNNLQRFSGSYIFIRHAVDHGNLFLCIMCSVGYVKKIKEI